MGGRAGLFPLGREEKAGQKRADPKRSQREASSPESSGGEAKRAGLRQKNLARRLRSHTKETSSRPPVFPSRERRLFSQAKPSPAPHPELTQPAPLLLLILRLLQPRPRSVPVAATAPRAVGVAATVAAQFARSLPSDPAAVAKLGSAAKRDSQSDSPGTALYGSLWASSCFHVGHRKEEEEEESRVRPP